VYLNHRLLRTALRVTARERPFSLRRWAWIAGFAALYFPIRTLVSVSRWLDRWLYPEFTRQPVREPVFIVGAPRSGTTFLQSLMALDEEHFAHIKLYHTILPSVVLLRGIRRIAALDRHCGRPFARLAGWLERSAFERWSDVHLMAFAKPEEDEGLLFWTFVGESIFLLFPYIEELREVAFPDQLPSRERRAFMRHYRRTMQRIVYATGPEKTLLSKSTSFAGRIDSMLEAYPDARIVHLVRHPYECLPSHVSAFYPAWESHSPEIARDSDVSRAYAEVATDWMRELYEKRSKFDAERYLSVRYRDLVRDPLGTIEGIYAHLGLEIGEDLRARLRAAVAESREYRSHHHYSLEEFGLSPEWVQERLGDVMDAYEFER